MDENETKDVDLEQEMPEKPDYEKELIDIIKSDDSEEEIREKLGGYHENDIANVLEELTPEERKRLYRILGLKTVSEVFSYLDDVEPYANELNIENLADIIEEMDADDAVDLLDEMEDDKSSQLIELIDEEARHDISVIQSYDEDEIGSRMTTNFILIHRGLTIKQAMRQLVEQAAENDNISTIYVEEKNGDFYGAIDLKELIIAREYDDLESLITTSYPYVFANESITETIEQLKSYSEDSIPVLDNDKHLIGVITSQDIVEVVDEEMSDDYAKLAGLSEDEDLSESLSESLKKRVPWLIVLLFLGLGVSSVVGLFENVVSELTIVVCFQSVILGMAGNVGTQSLAVSIRVLMDEELETGMRRKLIRKEMLVGLCNGAILGSIAFVVIGVFILIMRHMSPMFSFAVSGCIGLSLLAAMLISSFMGTAIPITLHQLKVDPAVASGPLISTINDLVAVLAYYSLVWLLLIHVLNLHG